MVDRWLFRPLLGWATAWSFDRLRLWLERGIDPATSMQRSIIHAISRVTLALIWIYQGLVPKLLFMSESGEVETVRAMSPFPDHAERVVQFAGVVEIAIGLAMLVFWRWRGLLGLNALAMAGLLVLVLIGRPILFTGQFNPATLNLAMAALGIVGWLAARDLPSAGRCLRREGTSA